MLTTNKTNSIVRSILGILLTVVLLTTTCPTIAYTAGDNLGLSTLDVFPALGVSSDTMDVNNGTINTLYGGGTVKDNRGTISSSLGTVFENHGTIEKLSAGHVGTNYGTINRIENTGSLGVNDGAGTVLFVGMGNEVFRNDGTIQVNIGNVSDNYGTVNDNYGTVIMHDGQVVYNYQNGIVTFEAKISGGKTIPAKGTIDNNEGHVKIHSGTVTIKENTGDIEITNATVTVSENAGSITLGTNATLKCDVNKSGGVITKTDKSASISCYEDNGQIYDETVVKYKIVFVGDDGKAEIIACDLEKDGVYYTQVGGGVVFTLPPEYECSAAMKYKSNIWVLDAFPAEGDTEFTIVCHKCSPCDSLGHTFENGVCTECGFAQFKFNSASLVLSGELVMDINCTVNDMEAVKDGYMLFEIGTTGEQKVCLSDLTAEEDGTYIFRCNINVLQMADPITVSFRYGDEVVGPHTTSVAQYLKNVVAKNSDNEKLVDLAHAIENYGHYAQIALQEVHGFTLGEDGKYQTMAGYGDIVLPDAAELAAYQATRNGSISQISKLSRALALDHGTDILLYFNCADGYTPDIAVTDKDGNAVACPLTKDENGRYILTIPSISAHKLGDFYTVSFDNGAMTIDICALSYAYSILNSSASSINQKNAVAALYAYYQAAIAYQSAHE